MDADLHNAHQLWLQRVTAKGPAAMRRLAEAAEAVARQHCPVDSGALLASITHTTQSTKLGASVGSVEVEVKAGDANAPYAAHVEYGDAPGSSPQPFMRPSADWVRENGAKVLAQQLRRPT